MTRAVLCDIEGTLGSISFVRDTLFPYAEQRLEAFVRAHAGQERVASELAHTASLAQLPPGDLDALIAQLLTWSRTDVKATPLKALQGMIWEDGYARGDYQAHVYPDAWRKLRQWRAQGLALYIYSSGSVQAQRLFFRYSCFGDLRPLLDGYFDTTTGAKREPEAYRRICRNVNREPRDLLFLSDIRAELDAALTAGLHTTWVVRPQDWPGQDLSAAGPHPVVTDFEGISP